MPKREYYSLPPIDGIGGSFFPIFVILKIGGFSQKNSLIYNIKRLQNFPKFWLKKQQNLLEKKKTLNEIVNKTLFTLWVLPHVLCYDQCKNERGCP
jgi:hypothetical protein